MFMPFFFFNDPATAEIYTYCTLSLHDALPISAHVVAVDVVVHIDVPRQCRHARGHFPYVQVVQSGHGGQSTDRLGNRDWIEAARCCLQKDTSRLDRKSVV